MRAQELWDIYLEVQACTSLHKFVQNLCLKICTSKCTLKFVPGNFMAHFVEHVMEHFMEHFAEHFTEHFAAHFRVQFLQNILQHILRYNFCRTFWGTSIKIHSIILSVTCHGLRNFPPLIQIPSYPFVNFQNPTSYYFLS